MKFTIEIDEDEIMEEVKQNLVQKISDRLFCEYRSPERYCYRTVIKECVREAIKSDIENLSNRAVDAASVSIVNKGLKKMSAEALLARLTESEDKE